jgi:hypothetical protein
MGLCVYQHFDSSFSSLLFMSDIRFMPIASISYDHHSSSAGYSILSCFTYTNHFQSVILLQHELQLFKLLFSPLVPSNSGCFHLFSVFLKYHMHCIILDSKFCPHFIIHCFFVSCLASLLCNFPDLYFVKYWLSTH